MFACLDISILYQKVKYATMLYLHGKFMFHDYLLDIKRPKQSSMPTKEISFSSSLFILSFKAIHTNFDCSIKIVEFNNTGLQNEYNVT